MAACGFSAAPLLRSVQNGKTFNGEHVVKSQRPKVVVIGAGIAGMSAAAKLHKSGQVEVCVLEASERVGGRIHTAKIGATKVDFGAAWIHGTVGNPIFDMACDLQLLCKADMNKSWANDDSRVKPEINSIIHRHMDDNLLAEVWGVFHKLILDTEDMEKMKSLHANGLEDASTMTVGDYLDYGFQSYLESCTSDTAEIKAVKRGLFRLLQERECNTTGCHSLYDVNLEEVGEYIFLEGSEYCPMPGGYNNILKALQTQFDVNCIHLNHKVTQINWTATSDDAASLRDHHPVKVLCSNGVSFDADHVILTVSLGVLKENWSSLFHPTLPANKINAIQKLGFGYVGKIFLEFEERFWSTDEYIIYVVWEDKDLSKQELGDRKHDFNAVEYSVEAQMLNCSWIRRLYVFHTTHPGSNILLAWFHGNESLDIETSSPEEVAQLCVAVLKKCTSLKSLPRLQNVHVTQWATNPLTQGSYSFLSKEASGSDFDCLATPIPHASAVNKDIPALQVMFAGEATHRLHHGTSHGAYFTGIREAERVLEYLNRDAKK